MNSVLNRELREKKGLVYTVDSSVSLLSDTGLLAIYYGCDPANVTKCRRIIEREIDRLCQNTLSAPVFERMKRQYCGQLLSTSDHIESRAMSLGKSVMYFDTIHDISTTAERIREVTAHEVREAAELISRDKLSTLTLT